MAVLPRPMSSARQPPSPRRWRNRNQLEAAPLVRPQLAAEPVRLVLLDQALVGQPGRAGRSSSRRRARRSTSPSPARRSSVMASTRSWSRSCSSSRRRARRSAAGSMRTHRRPVCSSVAPADSARASSASDSAVGPSSSATTIRHWTTASRPNCPGWSDGGAGAALPRTETPARTRRSGPMRSMPRRSSSAGACSRKRPASSTLELQRRRLVRRGQVGGDLDGPGQRPGPARRRRRPARRPATRSPASSTASGVASQTSSAVHHRPGSSSSTTSRRTSQSSYTSSGHDEADPGHDDGLAEHPPVVALEAGGQLVHLVGVGDGAAADQRIG